MAGFYLLLSWVPLYASRSGPRGRGGLVTGALMAATVAGELAVPRLEARFGYRVLSGGRAGAARGAPLALPAASALPLILLVSGSGSWASRSSWWSAGRWWRHCPAERRREGHGAVRDRGRGPGGGALPLGVWLVDRAGYPAVFVAGRWPRWPAGGRRGLPGRERGRERPAGFLAGLRTPALAGRRSASRRGHGGRVVVTFLPLSVTGGPRNLAALACSSRRWRQRQPLVAGRYGDRHGPATLLSPVCWPPRPDPGPWCWSSRPVAVVAGMPCSGALVVSPRRQRTLMLNRVRPRGYGR